ncbi:hypothetical protein CXF78_16715 [Shewanella sp. 11B5]|nr:hypothetical protein CXF78_16715 [Shewanella sp. 11B5]
MQLLKTGFDTFKAEEYACFLSSCQRLQLNIYHKDKLIQSSVPFFNPTRVIYGAFYQLLSLCDRVIIEYLL